MSLPLPRVLVRFLFVNTYARGKRRRREWREGDVLRQVASTKGTGHSPTLGHFVPPRPVDSRLKHEPASREGSLLHRCIREAAKSSLIICRVLPDSIYPQRSRITRRGTPMMQADDGADRANARRRSAEGAHLTNLHGTIPSEECTKRSFYSPKRLNRAMRITIARAVSRALA